MIQPIIIFSSLFYRMVYRSVEDDLLPNKYLFQFKIIVYNHARLNSYFNWQGGFGNDEKALSSLLYLHESEFCSSYSSTSTTTLLYNIIISIS